MAKSANQPKLITLTPTSPVKVLAENKSIPSIGKSATRGFAPKKVGSGGIHVKSNLRKGRTKHMSKV